MQGAATTRIRKSVRESIRKRLGRAADMPRFPELQRQVIRSPHLRANSIRRAETRRNREWCRCESTSPDPFSSTRRAARFVHLCKWGSPPELAPAGEHAENDSMPIGQPRASSTLEVRSEDQHPTLSTTAGRRVRGQPSRMKTLCCNLLRPPLLAGSSHDYWSCHRSRPRKRIQSTTSEHGAGRP